jgi:anthranilate phosphoribosyltransferase
MKKTLNHLFGHNTLSFEEAKNILKRIGEGEFSESEIASFLTVFAMRKITPEELAGFRMALLELSISVNFSGMNTIDVCGTGGDEKNTFNISTLTSFILAGAGHKVVKHGNYSVSSSCGSSNILEYFGYKFSNDQEKLRKEVDKANICYLHAPLFHPAMKYVAPVRKSLKIKTFFNILGPMINPCRPKNQIIGVFSKEVQDLYNNTYKDLDVNYSIVYALDGYDEISLTSDFRILSNSNEEVYTPESLNMNKVNPEELFGGNNVEQASKIFMDILQGKGTEAQINVVIANSAFGIKTMFPDMDIESCISSARESLENKNALKALENLIEIQ